MKRFYLAPLLACLALAGCGGGVDVYIDGGAIAEPTAVRPTYEYLTHPTISGLEYFNSVTGNESHLTTAAGRYTGYTGGDTVDFVLGGILLFSMPGNLPRPFASLYDASAYSVSPLYGATAVENLLPSLWPLTMTATTPMASRSRRR